VTKKKMFYNTDCTGRQVAVPGRPVRRGISGVVNLEGVVRNSRESRKGFADGAAQVERAPDHGTVRVRYIINNCYSFTNLSHRFRNRVLIL